MKDHLTLLDDISVPETLEETAYKAELFLIRGMNSRFLQYWEEVSKVHSGPKDIPLEQFHDRLHFRVCRMAFYRGHLRAMAVILDQITEPSPTYDLFKHLHWHYDQASMGLCFFPLNVDYREVDAGPHLPYDGSPTTWGAGRVDSVEEEFVQARLLEFEDGVRKKAGLIAIPVEVLDLWGSERSANEIEEGDHFELYRVGESEHPILRWWGRSWDGHDGLPPLRTDPLRYLRKAGWVADGDTFMERMVRGEVTMQHLEAAIADHGSNEKSKAWTLADHLGLLPEELERWHQEDDAYFLSLVEERQQLWAQNRDKQDTEDIFVPL